MSGALYIDAHGVKVGHSGGSLTLKYPDGKTLEYPGAQVERVFVYSHAHFSHAAISMLLRNAIPTIFASRRHGLLGQFGVSAGHQIERRIRQYDAMRDEGSRLDVARALIQAKLRSHGRLLDHWGAPGRAEIAHALLATHRCESLAALRGHEGTAARIFFEGLRRHLASSGFEFNRRQQHPPPDPVNAMLSLNYTLLSGEVLIGILGVGLDSAGSYFHEHGDGKAALVFDLVEPLRPLADRLSARLLRNDLTPDDFELTEQGCRIRDGRRHIVYQAWQALMDGRVRWKGEETTWRRIIHLQSNQLARWLDAKEKTLKFWHLDEP